MGTTPFPSVSTRHWVSLGIKTCFAVGAGAVDIVELMLRPERDGGSG